MQMVIGCGRGISGMAKNHINTNMSKLFLNPMLHLGPQKQWQIPKTSSSMFTLCLDKAVLAQGGGVGSIT